MSSPHLCLYRCVYIWIELGSRPLKNDRLICLRLEQTIRSELVTSMNRGSMPWFCQSDAKTDAMAYAMTCQGICHGMQWHVPWHATAYTMACHGICHGICHGMPWHRPWHMPWHMPWHAKAYALACHGIRHGMPWHMPWHMSWHGAWHSALASWVLSKSSIRANGEFQTQWRRLQLILNFPKQF